MKWLPLILLICSCAQLNHYKVYKSQDGLYKYQHRGTKTQNALRDNSNKLIRSELEAKKQFSNYKSVTDLKKSFLPSCEDRFNFRKSYHRATEVIYAGNLTKGRLLLEKISKDCKNIKFYSHIDYLYAYSYEREENFKQRDKYLEDFLNYSQAIFPPNFSQSDTKDEEALIFKKFKAHAKKVLAGESFKLYREIPNHYTIPRYNSLNDSYLAGTKVTDETYYVIPGYSTVTKGSLEGAYVLPTKYGAFIPGLFMNDPFGTLGRINYRKQLSESLNRKHQTGINIGLYQWKTLSYSRDLFGTLSNVKIKDEGVGTRLGYGGTYQFTTKYNFMYQVAGNSDYATRSNLTALMGYNIDGISMFQYGLLHNQTVIAWKVKQIYIMYNLSMKAIDVNIATGFAF